MARCGLPLGESTPIADDPDGGVVARTTSGRRDPEPDRPNRCGRPEGASAERGRVTDGADTPPRDLRTLNVDRCGGKRCAGDPGR
jgi:hypothetical protein